MTRPYVIGLTGGIASGKTLAADIMRECGAYIIDTDEISRRLTAPGTAGARAIAAAFPVAAAGDGFDRRVLKHVVFNDEDSLKRLNAITHPLITREVLTELDACGAETAVLVVPLLFETGMEGLCDLTVTVSCPEDERIKRLVKRDTIPIELARSIVGCQMTDAEREKRADAVVRNTGSVARFRDEVKQLYYEIIERQ